MDIGPVDERVLAYLNGDNSRIKGGLGIGNDGRVWHTDRTAIKVFWLERKRAFETELACYLRLAEHDIGELLGFTIPRLVNYRESLLIVEMEFVSPPCMFDFGKAYIDIPPRDDFDDVEAWQIELRDQWGSKLPLVKRLVAKLENYGIYYRDPRPGNIKFPGHADEE